jgi:hypothetical protein
VGHGLEQLCSQAFGGVLLAVPLALAAVFESKVNAIGLPYFWIILAIGGVAGVVLHNRRRLSGRSGTVLRVATYILVGLSLICLLAF